ncbi:DNA mismatch repair endonuclease MutL [Anaerococcus prevotii]|uniref:DNA mismatch repair endonuclease MutL n=1 Tax=Anaerococcus prevotii TaxID=33034 RepID=UPI002804901D|nr:DNA mismatch repair endonuclease MutL [Anaerococcus prevotii]MDU2557360.1 DNA mismatch repair endonuclease MutL [Anaerococcus prevotii]
MTILKLDDKTIEKIAAGEVIESPVSIVKELVENSIDAGADSITVEIKNGGKTYIRVTDNGSGISKNEIELAFSKHATSKIRDFNDLYDIYSLGFRGEALASIVSVSKVTAISKTKDEMVGTKINFNNGEKTLTSIATNVGTSIVVKDLFRDIPVRRRFLKSDIVESNHISKLMYAIAIGYPEISFKFIKNENIEFSTIKNEDIKIRIAKLLDDKLEDHLIKISDNNEIYNLDGFISNNNYYRGNRSLQYIYINNRLVESELIRDRIEIAYRGNIPNGRFPVFFLYIKTNPKNIDINVHPNKRVIKFSYEDQLIDLIDSSISKFINASYGVKGISIKENNKNDLMDFSDYAQILNNYNNTQSLVKESSFENIYDTDKNESYDDYEDNSFFNSKTELSFEEEEKYVEEGLNKGKIIEKTFDENSYIEDFEYLNYKCSIFARYSIFERKNKLFILDHRRATEKINFNKFLNQFENKTIDEQLLLDPLIINLSKFDIDRFSEKKDIINRLGFDAEIIGDRSIIIRSVPFIFSIPEDDKFFYDLLDLDYSRDTDYLYKKLRKLNLSLSFRKGDKINEEEAYELISKLKVLENPYTTYDGKAVLVKIDEKDVEKYFER